MSHRQQILDRLSYLQAELAALTALMRLEGQAVPVAGLPAPVAQAATAPVEAPVADLVEEELPPEPGDEPEPEAAGKVRWKYTGGARYRIVGPNPFRNGNNYNLFAHLAETYGTAPFSRAQLTDAIEALKASGQIVTVQQEPIYALVFLQFAGPQKGALRMVTAAPAAQAKGVSLKQKQTGRWRMTGRPSFHKGSINAVLWDAVQGRSVNRAELGELIERLKADGQLASDRPADAVARHFLGTVIDRGLADPA